MKKPLYPFLVLALFSSLFLLFFSSFERSEVLQKWALETRDILFRIRHASALTPERARDIVIVAIDEESCEKLKIRWPWPRKIFASLIQELTGHGAKVIGLNLSFTGLEDGDAASSQALSEAVRAHGNVVFGTTFDKNNRMIQPTPILAGALAGCGYLEKIVDKDFLNRRSYLLLPYS